MLRLRRAVPSGALMVLIGLVAGGRRCSAETPPSANQTLKHHENLAAVANFATDDLLQGLCPEKEGGLCPSGTYITETYANDARSAGDPGGVGPNVDRPWCNMPAYLVYRFRRPVDVSEIRITAVPPSGEAGEHGVAAGEIALGIARQTNRGGRPPIRPAENAIEVLVDGQTLWEPVVGGTVWSGGDEPTQGVCQGVWRFGGHPVRQVRRIKFALGPTRTWSSGNHGRMTRLSEIDVIGRPSGGTAPSPWRFVRATDRSIAPRGFVTVEPNGALLMKWSGSGLRCRFRSDRCRLRFQAASGSRYWVKLDGGPYREFPAQPIIDLTQALRPTQGNVHEIEVVKKTEFVTGLEVLQGLELAPGATLLPMSLPERRILFLGDSIAVGMGAGLAGETDVLRSYAWLLGRHFGADIRLVAVSGVGVYKGWRATPFMREWQAVVSGQADAATRSPAGLWQPDLVLVNLGTNDASKSVPAEHFIPAMKALLTDVRARCPEAAIAVMVPWTYGCYRAELRGMVEELSKEGLAKLHFIDADPATWAPKQAMRDNTHPNHQGHALATGKLIPRVQAIMGWGPTTTRAGR